MKSSLISFPQFSSPPQHNISYSDVEGMKVISKEHTEFLNLTVLTTIATGRWSVVPKNLASEVCVLGLNLGFALDHLGDLGVMNAFLHALVPYE